MGMAPGTYPTQGRLLLVVALDAGRPGALAIHRRELLLAAARGADGAPHRKGWADGGEAEGAVAPLGRGVRVAEGLASELRTTSGTMWAKLASPSFAQVGLEAASRRTAPLTSTTRRPGAGRVANWLQGGGGLASRAAEKR